MTRRHPDDALVSNLNDTAPPRGRAAQQSPMAQRHPRDTPTSNPHVTAPHTPHTRRARRQSSQPATAFHGTAPHARHTGRSVPLRSKKHPLQAYIHKSTDSLRLPRFRNAQRVNAGAHSRFLAQGHEIKRFQLPRTIPCACHAKQCPARPPVAPFPTPATRNARCVHASPRRPRESTFATPPVATLPHTCHVKRTRTNVQMHISPHLPRESTLQCLPERGHASGVPRLPRETHVTARNIIRARNTPDTNPHGTAPPTRPATRPRHTLRHARHARSATRPRARSKHAQTRPIPAACHAKRCPARPPVAPFPTPSQCTRRHSESIAPSRIPAQGHGFENLVVATAPP